jgi:SAM-dependent methyltransferase
MILKEHKYRPITGEVVLIGRQTVLLTVEEAFALIASEGVELRSDFLHEIDKSTVGSDVAQYITDQSFFSMFSDAKVIALDVSDYEAADIIHDLNTELPAKYESVADFIFNGSCLDNMFDPATAIKSISKMLKPHGRIFHLEHGSPIQGAFLCYSPEWFFDFYAINNYSDCQNFVCTFGSSLVNDWEVFRWKPYYFENGHLKASSSSIFIGDFINIVIAEKGASSTDSQTPIQSHYRGFQEDSTESIYVSKYKEFSRAGREFTFIPEVPRPPEPALPPAPPQVKPPAPTPPPPRRTGLKGFVLRAFNRCGLTIRRGGSRFYRIERLKKASSRDTTPWPPEAIAEPMPIVPVVALLKLGGTAHVETPRSLNKPELERLGMLLR